MPEFHSAELASWLIEMNVGFVFRQKKTTNLQIQGQDFQSLAQLNIKQGTRLFWGNIKVNKGRTKTGLSMAIYWKRRYRGMGELEPWYLLTNLPDLPDRVKNQIEYIGRMRKIKQKSTKNSDFWIGLYGSSWVISHHLMRDWVEALMRLNSNKLSFYQRGQRAMSIIQQAV